MSGSSSGLHRAMLGALIALPALLAEAWPAAGADAPSAEAMRGEVARGIAAAERCAPQVWSTEDYASCIDGLIGTAATEDAAAAPFQLGVYCTAFRTSALAYRDWSRKPASGPAAGADGGLLRENTLDHYDSCVFQAQRAKLEAHRICAALGTNCAEFNQMLDRWKATTRADE
ncbi:MAG TPA: hypothetical protein VEI03_23235 [Stellaceae bacterium]|nr:hypothetical protein [Stellaceae bacterium]